jgi:HlyD family secretion protein
MLSWIKRHPVWTGLIVVGVLLAGFMATRGGEKPPEVLEDKVSKGVVERTVSASGKLRAQNTVLVGAEVSGQIQQLAVDFNSEVRRGQLLARIDPTRFEAAVLQAAAQVKAGRAALEQAQAQLTRANAQVALQERELKRRQQLLSRDFVSQAAVDVTQTALESARADRIGATAALSTARAQIAQAEAGLSRAQLDLNRTRIVAPIDGVVINRQVDVGQTVVSSFQAPNLFEIAQDLTSMRVEASVDEADIGQIQIGQNVRFRVDSYPGETFTGSVNQIRKASREVQNVVTYLVLLDVPNPQGKLLPGMTANIEIITGLAKDVLRVPTAALRYKPRDPKAEAQPAATQAKADAESPSLYRKDANGFPEKIDVKTGLESEQFTQLTGGPLKEGDAIILRAKPQLRSDD